MKYLILLALLLVPTMGYAQQSSFTPVPKDKANAYYQSCVHKALRNSKCHLNPKRFYVPVQPLA